MAEDLKCVAGCHRCVLSYFNQPDHERIDRRNREALSFLLMLAHSDELSPKVDSAPGNAPSENSPPRKSAPDGAAYGHPSPDGDPYVRDDVGFQNVSRSARAIVGDEGEIEEEMRTKPVAKGFAVLERPLAPERQAEIDAELGKAPGE